MIRAGSVQTAQIQPSGHRLDNMLFLTKYSSLAIMLYCKATYSKNEYLLEQIKGI